MFHKILYASICYILFLSTSFAQNAPGISGTELPGYDAFGSDPSPATNDEFLYLADAFISYFIQIVAVIAVLSLMISGIMLIISGGEEEKLKKSKSWFTWSLVGVFISLTAWFMINFLNRLNIG